MSLFRRIRPEKTGVRAPLGDLEQAIMRHIWPCGESGCLATEVQQGLEQVRPIALTTVLTTLDRLHDKGILLRVKEGKAYRYRAALTEEQLQQRIVEGVLGDLISQFPKAVATYFAQQGLVPETQDKEETEHLRELASRLEALRTSPTQNTGDKAFSPELSEEDADA
jgi:predicted transcriptional regulator